MPAPFVEDAFFFPPILYFQLLCKKSAVCRCGTDIRVSSLIPLVALSVFMSVSGCFHYCSSIIKFEVRDCDASRSSFIAQDCCGYPVGFFPYEVEYCYFEVCEELCWDFDGDCSEPVDCFW